MAQRDTFNLTKGLPFKISSFVDGSKIVTRCNKSYHPLLQWTVTVTRCHKDGSVSRDEGFMSGEDEATRFVARLVEELDHLGKTYVLTYE